MLLYNGVIGSSDDYYHLNSPPTIHGDRNWFIPNNTPVNQLVKKIEAFDAENDTLEFGIDHSTGFNVVPSNPEPLPFTVDSKRGYVYTNQSLMHMGGQDIYMYVTVYDGHQISKVQVRVKIEDVSKSGSAANFPPVKDNIPILPPNMKLPSDSFGRGVPNIPSNLKPKQPTKLNHVTTITNNDITIPVNSSINTSSSPSPTVPNVQQLPDSVGNKNDHKKEVTDDDSPVINKTSIDSRLDKLDDSTKKLFIMILPVTVLVTSLLISGILTFLFRKRLCSKRQKKNKDELKKKSTGSSISDSMVLQHWIPRIHGNKNDTCDVAGDTQGSTDGEAVKNSDKWEFPRHHIKVFNILGEGCFAQVWKCEALNIDNKDGYSVVAVKMLRENPAERDRSDLLQELQVMKMLDPHPNVVRLLGCCTEKDPVFLIMEYIMKGKLQSYLRDSRTHRYYNNMHGSSDCLTSQNLTSFCYQIAKGMQYLSSKGIIHRDLAARNILVTEDHTCKIADFGFARDVMSSHVYERKSEGRLPIRWMAPESLYDNIFSVKSDIWSYGVLIWEVVTLGSTPYPGISAADVMRRVRDGYRLEKPEHCRRELYNIMYYCWDKDAQERPNFSELVELLEQLLLTETDYIQLDRFPDHSYYNMIPLNGEKV